MVVFRENRISIVDLFPPMSAWSKRQRKTKQTSVDHSGKLTVDKGQGSKANTLTDSVLLRVYGKSNPKCLALRSMLLKGKGKSTLNKAH